MLLHAQYNRVHTGLANSSIANNPHGFSLETIKFLDQWYQGKPWDIGLNGSDREKVQVKIVKKGHYADLIDVAAPKEVWDKICIPD